MHRWPPTRFVCEPEAAGGCTVCAACCLAGQFQCEACFREKCPKPKPDAGAANGDGGDKAGEEDDGEEAFDPTRRGTLLVQYTM